MNYLIGCGGIGSWLLPALLKITRERVMAIDGDTLEKKNLDRQFYTELEIGKNKALAAADLYGCDSTPQYYNDTFEHGPADVLLVCVDNHVARACALRQCDRHRCKAIIAANEKRSAEAYFYRPDWRGTERDPRSYYPELLTDHTGDPLGRAIGCVEAARNGNVQLASANFMAAALALHLYVAWVAQGEKLRDVRDHLPYRLGSTLSRLTWHALKGQDHERNDGTEGGNQA